VTSVLVGADALSQAQDELETWADGRQLFLVTSEEVAELHPEVLDLLRSLGDRSQLLFVPDGERAKTLPIASSLWSSMVEAAGHRDSRLVAFGGGSVGDLAGFVAATFLRGIEFALVPTTLLAQVDASIGGKTGIDLVAKNTVGAFWHPHLVVADSLFLRTLPSRELRAGMAEVVKVAAADDAILFSELESTLPGALDGSQEALDRLIVAAVAAKIRVVEGDPREGNRRRILNLGHTLGHAIESVLAYRDLRHGEAVNHGLQFACRLARGRGADPDFLDRLEGVLSILEPPALPPLDSDDLLDALEKDKKATQSGLIWVLPMRPGDVDLVSDLPRAEVRSEIDAFLVDSRA
jgi:3-dehydroquinate synthase